MSKKIFIECGANNGDNIVSLRNSGFLDKFNEIYCFEALPYYNDKEIYKNLNFINKAVWIENGKIKVYVAGKDNMSSSVLLSKFTSNANKYILVDSIDFSEWLKNNFQEDDDIFLDMDIECAEYFVVKKLIDDKTINYIKHLSIEWHGSKCRLKDLNEQEFKNQIKNFKHLNIVDHDLFLINPNQFYK